MATFLIPLAAFVILASIVFGLGAVLLAMTRIVGYRRGRKPLVFGVLTVPLAYMFCVRRSDYETLEQETKRAGHYSPHAMEEFLAVRNILLAGWVLFVCAAILGGRPEGAISFYMFAIGAAGLAVVYAMPRIWLRGKGNRRVRQIQNELPDALDMISMCLSGGMPLQEALRSVSDELGPSHPELAREFQIVQQQADSHTLSLAIDQFASRIDVEETQALAALVSQTERLGTNIASALRDYSDSIRRSFRQRAEEQGNKASVKMLLPVSFCLAPPVYILLLAPAMLELRDFVMRENRPGGVLSQAADGLDEFDQVSETTLSQTRRTTNPVNGSR